MPTFTNSIHEPAIDPQRPIVDAHHHLRERHGETYLAPEFLQDIRDSGHNIVATVAVETGVQYFETGPVERRPVGETQFLNKIARETEQAGGPKIAAAIVATADLRLGESIAPVLEAHVAAGQGRFRGIRTPAAWHTTDALKYVRSPVSERALRDASFRAGFSCLARHRLSYDAWVYHTQLDDLIYLARNFPDTTIVLNHVGGPLGAGPYEGHRNSVFSEWATSMKRVAACPSIVVKLGGFGMPIMGFGFDRANDATTSERLATAWRPYVETCVEMFGAHRCMFESNFPPDKVSCSYGQLWNAFKRIVAGVSEDEKNLLFENTARRVYQLRSESITP